MVTAGKVKPFVGVSSEITVLIGKEKNFLKLMTERNMNKLAAAKRNRSQIARFKGEWFLWTTCLSPWRVVLEANSVHSWESRFSDFIFSFAELEPSSMGLTTTFLTIPENQTINRINSSYK